MALPAGLRALGQPDFRVYFAGNLVAQIGSWMQTVSQSWLVLQLSSSPFRLGLISTLQSAPVLLFSVFMGVLADRLVKRRLLMLTQVVQGCLALGLGLLVWGGHVAYWHVAVMAVVWGVMNAVDQPTRLTFVMELVGRESVASAVGLNSASFNGARIVGPAVAGLLIARVGLSSGFLLNALAFVVAIWSLGRVPARPPRARPAGATFADELREGLGYSLRTPSVRLALALQVVVSFCVFNFTVYVPLLATTVLGLGSEGFGLLMTALGVGALSAGLSIGALGSRGLRPRGIALALAVSCGSLLGLAGVRHFGLAAALLVVTGFSGTIVSASCTSFLQLNVPDVLRGRVLSLYAVLSGGIFPIGAFWVGTVSQWWGVSWAFGINGAIGLAALALLRPWAPRPALMVGAE